MSSFLSIVSLSLFFTCTARAADLPFYAFQNGVRRSSDELRAELLKKVGFDGIGSARLPEDGNLDSLFSAYRDRELKVFSFYTGATITADGATVPPGLLESIPKLKDSGVVLEFFVKGDKRYPKENAIEIVRKVADLAAESNISIVLYPHTNMYVETLAEAVELAKAVDRKNVGVMFNLCHFLRVEPEADLRASLVAAGDLLRQVSLSGADVGGKSWQTLIQPLGEGTYDVGPVLGILEKIGFAGPVGLQCYNIKGKSEVFLAKSFKAWETLKVP